MKVKIFILPLLLLTAACSNQQPQSDSRLHVETAQAVTTRIAPTSEFSFIAKPLRTSVLSFRVSGPVEEFDVYAGDRYRCGDLIAGIDPRDFRLRYEQAEAACRQAQADYERVASLFEKDNLPASSYETARAAWITAKTRCDAALNELNDTRLLAPFDGYVGEVFIERHEDVKASQPIVTLVDISSLRIEIYVTQEIAMQAEHLKQVNLAFDHCPDQIFQAEVIQCARSTTPNNLSYLLTALLPNPEGALPAGVSGKVFLDLNNVSRQVVTVPQKALCHRPESGDYVWVIDSLNRVSQRAVSFDKLLPDGQVSVSKGIAPGERVVVSGLRFLEEGMEVDTPEQTRSTR